MDMLENLKKLNTEISVYSVNDPEFGSYGRVVSDIDTKELMEEAKKQAICQDGTAYVPSLDCFEALSIKERIRDELFGTLPIQMGYCHGRNSYLNAAEWHTSSEVNVALTDMVLILGHVWDIEDGKISSDKFEAFLVPAGTCIEVYATSLHFCPCEVSETGFGALVALPVGTNVPLDAPTGGLLFRKNKWIIAHEGNQGLLDRGVIPGIFGTNHKISY